MNPAPGSTSSPLADVPGAPDWASIPRDVNCPLCDYNLRGLIDPRCPECGYSFAWDAVLNPDKYRHPYLFEHHPDRKIASFFKTLIHQAKPQNFWRKLDATRRLYPRRIVLYWALCCLPLLLPIVAAACQYAVQMSSSSTPLYMSSQSWADRFGWHARVLATWVLLLAAFPWLSALSLLVFQQSMRRAKIKPVHVLRCAIYCGDVIFWAAFPLAIVFAFDPENQEIWHLRDPFTSILLCNGVLPILMALGLLILTLANTIRLIFAYRLYMQFEHPGRVIIASQIIVFLAALGWITYFSGEWF